MFGWFRPVCPVDAAAKHWIETRLLWLCEQFGRERLLESPVLLPTPEYFPDPYDASEEAGRVLFARVCHYMGVMPERISLRFFRNAQNLSIVDEQGFDLASGASGTFETNDSAPDDDAWKYGGPSRGASRPRIRLENSSLNDPVDMIGTMAHELAHQRLMGEGRVSGQAYDNELLTDLTAVFHGFGVFLSTGATRRFYRGSFALWPGTGLKKPEYMTLPMYGYVLAHVAWLRQLSKPDWRRDLRPDVRAAFKQGLRFLEQTGETKLASLRSPAAGTD